MLEAVISRIEASVPQLAGRTQGAVQFAELMRTGNLPQVTPAAHVLPLGFTGGQPDAMAGAFVQPFDRAIAVMLTLRSYDASGEKALDPLEALITAIVTAIAGWQPPGAPGVYRLSRAALVSMTAGTLVYQIDFAIADQLRIFP
ncbi:phage tail terminator protein [Acidimangrovimonas sediminis]|uniref:phage tail terminator protein n=1 Tax=Acidimangrovimonas sediminis TaxID=2056283 RepID=UPI000C802057|nr:hypothetical protein [Acidimangrovimonas sediminis]